ncbi:plasmid segregation centromere-binding protein ParR [Nodularia harveyana UHCC-0300]|uniref:Plasmid segregation centromere-binding protein ParR n=1 Tax=Nodularia harveyana UHCC-0300 TaxID=2974287 RepID=A0ABU5U902_9CYAN|nr:plasmid segregation centromere-binding protein ParR [Nodularia harveyana]MEA5579972.1 plasmid segregation centromere-binding protein ParR [Nodularia harveyana UHCC-0300]
MFQWSKKVVKSVTFNPEVADESLLAVVENYLEQLPDKTFSDICKEALWQSLCVPEAVKPSPKTVATDSVGTKIDELQRQLADLEERFFTKESHRLESIEGHILQLTQQIANLATIVSEQQVIHSSIPSAVESELANATYADDPPEEIDPVISRLSQFLDDF